VEEANAEALYAAVTQRFVNQVNDLLQQVAERQPDQFAHLPQELDPKQGFRIRSRFYFHDMIGIARPASPLTYFGDVLLGVVRIRYFFRKAANDFLEKLLDTNASRVQADVEQRVVESRRMLESQVRKILHKVIFTAEQALASAKSLTESGNAAIENELKRLCTLENEIHACRGLDSTEDYREPTIIGPERQPRRE